MASLVLPVTISIGSPPQSLPLDSDGWSTPAPGRTFYVSSSTGNDNNPGGSDSLPLKTLVKGFSKLRSGTTDWLVLKRGDVWQEELGLINRSGTNGRERLVFSTYGIGPRPKLVIRRSCFDMMASHHAVIGWHFYSEDSIRTSAFYLDNKAVGTGNLLLEDCVFENLENGVTFTGNRSSAPHENLEVRRCVFADCGRRVPGANGYALFITQSDSHLIEECLFDNPNVLRNLRCNNNSPTWTNNTRDERPNYIYRRNIIGRASTQSQLRRGGTFTNNLVVGGPGIRFGNDSGDGLEKMPEGIDAHVEGNVFSELQFNNNPGQGINLNNVREIDCLNNLLIHCPSSHSQWAIGVGKGTSGPPPNGRNLSLRNNLVFNFPKGTPGIFDNLTTLIEEENYWYDSASTGWIVQGTNKRTEEVVLVEENRSVARYNQFLGGPLNTASFLQEARTQSKEKWRPQFTAAVANNWIREGYQVR